MAFSLANRIGRSLQNGLMGGVLIGVALVIVGYVLNPATNPLSVISACLILGVYGLVSLFGIQGIRSDILRWACVFGLAAGVVFPGKILLEYIFLPQDDITLRIESKSDVQSPI